MVKRVIHVVHFILFSLHSWLQYSSKQNGPTQFCLMLI